MDCPKCGTSGREGRRFCSACGTRMEVEAQTPQVVPAAEIPQEAPVAETPQVVPVAEIPQVVPAAGAHAESQSAQKGVTKWKILQVVRYAGCAMTVLGFAVVIIVNVLGLIFDIHYLCLFASVIPLVIAGLITAAAWLVERLL